MRKRGCMYSPFFCGLEMILMIEQTLDIIAAVVEMSDPAAWESDTSEQMAVR